MYVHEDILIPILMQSRLSGSKTIKCRSDVGFSQINLILKKEQSVIESIRCIQMRRYTNSIHCFELQD